MKRKRTETLDSLNKFEGDRKLCKTIANTPLTSSSFEHINVKGSIKPLKKFYISKLQCDVLEVPQKKLLFFTTRNTEILSLPTLKPIKTLKKISLAQSKNFKNQYIAGLTNSTYGISIALISLTSLKVQMIVPEKYLPSKNFISSIKHFDCYIKDSKKYVVYNTPEQYVRIYDINLMKEVTTYYVAEEGIRKMKVQEENDRLMVVTNSEFAVLMIFNVLTGKVMHKINMEDRFPIRESIFFRNGAEMVNISYRCLEIISLKDPYGSFERKRIFFKEAMECLAPSAQTGLASEFNHKDYQIMISPSLANELILCSHTQDRIIKVSMSSITSKFWQIYFQMERNACMVCLPMTTPNSSFKVGTYYQIVVR